MNSSGGETGIRTLGRVASTTVFETAPFNHSGTSPLYENFNQKLVTLQQPLGIPVVDIPLELRDIHLTKKVKMQLRSCRRI